MAWSAVFWLAAGVASGLVIAGSTLPSIGIPVAIGSAAAAVAILLRRPAAENPTPAAAPAPRDEATLTSAALCRAMADLDQPDAALQEMLRLVGSAIESRTILLLRLTDGDAALALDHVVLIDGKVPTGPPATSMSVTDSGPLRMALAAGVPIAASAWAGDPGAWAALAADHGFEAATIVPLGIANSQIGLLVIAADGVTVPKAHPPRLRRIMPAAGASIGAILRLRHDANATAQSAKKARFRSDYASVVGHELRTPLTTILGVIKTLARPEFAPENSDARELLEMASVQGDRLKRLVEDMLAINQVDNDGIPVHPGLVSLDDLIDRAIDAVSGAEGLVTVRMQDSIPPIVIDPEHTKRVLVNLLSNSVKYGEDSPIEISVRVKGHEMVLTVADHGPGLPRATAASAFDAFTQLNRTEVDAYGGVGLGLSISQGLIGAMGGTIVHEPTPGGGATFIIRLPFKPHPGRRTGR